MYKKSTTFAMKINQFMNLLKKIIMGTQFENTVFSHRIYKNEHTALFIQWLKNHFLYKETTHTIELCTNGATCLLIDSTMFQSDEWIETHNIYNQIIWNNPQI